MKTKEHFSDQLQNVKYLDRSKLQSFLQTQQLVTAYPSHYSNSSSCNENSSQLNELWFWMYHLSVFLLDITPNWKPFDFIKCI